MPTYIVTFEVGAARLPLFKEALKSFSGYCPINSTSCAITADSAKAVEVINILKAKINATDRLFVIRSGTDAAWLNAYGEKNDDWLKKYL